MLRHSQVILQRRKRFGRECADVGILRSVRGALEFRNIFLVLAVLAVGVFASALFFPSRDRIRQAPSAAATT